MRSDIDRALDIVDAVGRIRRHTAAGRDAFDASDLVQVWVVHHLQVIGEAANGLTQQSRDSHAVVPWRSVVGMRHVLVHGYFEIDLELVWSVVETGLDSILAAAETIANAPEPHPVSSHPDEGPDARLGDGDDGA